MAGIYFCHLFSPVCFNKYLSVFFFSFLTTSFLLHRERVCTTDESDSDVKHNAASLTLAAMHSPQRVQPAEDLQSANRNAIAMQNSPTKPKCGTHSRMKSDGIVSKCIGLIGNDRKVQAV